MNREDQEVVFIPSLNSTPCLGHPSFQDFTNFSNRMREEKFRTSLWQVVKHSWQMYYPRRNLCFRFFPESLWNSSTLGIIASVIKSLICVVVFVSIDWPNQSDRSCKKRRIFFSVSPFSKFTSWCWHSGDRRQSPVTQPSQETRPCLYLTREMMIR